MRRNRIDAFLNGFVCYYKRGSGVTLFAGNLYAFSYRDKRWLMNFFGLRLVDGPVDRFALRMVSLLGLIWVFSIGEVSAKIYPDTLSIPEVEIHSLKKSEVGGVNTFRVDTLVMMREADVSLSDLLSAHTSVFIKSEGRGSLATASFRGTDASHTAVFWNGISLTSPMLGQVDFSQIPVYLLDDVSLHPGASSLVDASGSFGGSILLQTKLKWKKQVTLRAMSAVGSYHTFNHYLKVNVGTNHLQSSTRVYLNQSKNDFPFYNKNIADIDPVTGAYTYPLQKNEEAAYRMSGVMQSLGYRFKKHYLLHIDYWYQQSDRALPRLNTFEGDDHANRSRQSMQTHRAVFRLNRFGKKSQWAWQSGWVVENMDYRVKNLVFGSSDFDAVIAVSKMLSSYNSLRFSERLSSKTLLKASYDFNFYHVNTLDSVSQNGYNRYRRNHRMMVSWQQQITPRISSLLLLRKEWVNHFDVPLIPYLGFHWQLDESRRWWLHAHVARNYHFPALNDLYWQPGGNPELKPEEGLATELGMKMSPKLNRMKFQMDLTLFYQDIQHWILWMPSPMGFWTPQNIRHVISKGIELNTRIGFQIKKVSVNLKAGYAFTKSQNQGDAEKWGVDAIGKQIPYVPVHSGNITVNLQWKLFHLTWVNNDYSERFTTSTNQTSLRDWLYPYFMNQLYLGKDFKFRHMRLQLQLKVYNLFNEDYRSVLGRPMPGRNYLFEMTFAL